MSDPHPSQSATSASSRRGTILHCQYCERTFTKLEHCRRHERSHTGARPFSCAQCGRAFGRADSLLRHERLHTRESSQPSQRMRTPESVSSAKFSANRRSSSNAYATASAIPQSTEQSTTSSPFAPPTGPTLQSHQSQNVPQAPELDFSLTWPDSEDLFQSLLSSDSQYQSHGQGQSQPQSQFGMAALAPQPLTPSSQASSTRFLTSTAPLHERPTSDSLITRNPSSHNILDLGNTVSSLSTSLTEALQPNSVTPVFLDEALHVFFVRFVPVLPILHRPTFVFRECAHVLILNAIAIGSLYMGPSDSAAKGEAIWRLAHNALGTSWQDLINHRGRYDACNGIQLVVTAFLSQLYGALSRDRSIRTTSQAFHNTGLFWARHCGMFETEPFSSAQLPPLDASHAAKDAAWRTWVSREIQQRALLSHYMLDGLVSLIMSEPATERHTSNPMLLPSNEGAFNAANADDWLAHMRAHSWEQRSFRAVYRHLFAPVPQSLSPGSASVFGFKVILEGLQAMVSDHDESSEAALGVPNRAEVDGALMRVFEQIRTAQLQREDRLEIIMRWHSVCIENIVRTSALCRAICTRYGIVQHVWNSARPVRILLDWIAFANSSDARRALLHSISIQDSVEVLPRGRAHCIHMPSSLFSAATIYAAFTLAGLTTVNLPGVVDWGVVLSGRGEDAFTTPLATGGSADAAQTARYVRGEALPGYAAARTTRNMLYEFNSVQKLFRCLYTQWGIAVDMEEVVDQWIRLCH